MNDPFQPESDCRPDDCVSVAERVPDPELADLFLAYPWLKSLEPFYVEWELIWLM